MVRFLSPDAQLAELVITPLGETNRPRPGVDSALVKALARAHRWQRLLESGECANITRARGG